MKKLNLKNILKRFTVIDLIIIICVVVGIIFAFIHIGADDNSSESVSFDSSTLNKLNEKYLSFYQEGKIVKTQVGGYNASSGEYVEITGRVLWVDDYKGSNVKVLIDVDDDSSSEPIVASLYKDVKNADIYIEHITLETTGEKYENVTEIKINPQNINTLDEIANQIDNNTNYTISTKIAIDEKTSSDFMELSNTLFLNGRKESIKSVEDSIYNQIELVMAGKEELAIASNILGNINGKTSLITIRVYNSNPREIENITQTFNVISSKKIS